MLESVDLSRLQFALTAMYHFMFVPLTLGLSILLAIMESVYVMSGKTIWRDITKFWGILFGINFAMGVATGITLEFQFGTNWAYYSHYVGDIFGSILAIEGLMAFFLEATLIGLFFFAWDKISKVAHLCVTWFLALATNLSALWILIANGWMQNPVGSYFNFATMRMELKSFYEIFFNPVAQSKFVHTVSSGYVTGSVFVMAISAFYVLKKRNFEFAKRSMTVAASFGLASALSVVVLGDESGYATSQNQKMKLASIEAMWETEPAPAGFAVLGWPDIKNHVTHYELKIPWLLGLIATRSLDQEVTGIKDLVKQSKMKIVNGIKAYDLLQQLKSDPENEKLKDLFTKHSQNLGYGLLLKKYSKDPLKASDEMIEKAAWDTVPNVLPLFFSFRVMVAIGFFFIAYFSYAFYLSACNRLLEKQWFLKLAVCSLPLPWIAAQAGWIVAEHGRQPWVIEGILPTFMAASNISETTIWLGLTALVALYTVLAVVEMMLMIKYVKKGPEHVGL